MSIVSVVIPSYNNDKYLSECIESVLAQSFSDLEIIIVDGCSSDNSQKIIMEYFNKDSRIKFRFQEKNYGVSKARNEGIAISKGEFIAILDSDDIMAPTRVEELYNALRINADCALAHTDVLIIDAEGYVTGKIVGKMKYSSGNIRGEVLRRRGCHIGYPMFRKKCLNNVGLYDESLQGGEDYDLYTRITRDYPIIYIPKSLLYYRRHSANASSKLRLMMEHYKRYLDKTFREDVDSVYANIKYEAYSHYFIDKINIEFHENRRKCLTNFVKEISILIIKPYLFYKMIGPITKVGIFRIERIVHKKYAKVFNKEYVQVGW